MPRGGWEDQYKRMRRALAKIDRDESSVPREEYKDLVISFFQHAWHLKDWLKNDPNIAQAARGRVEKLANDPRPLRITADLANRSKHFVLTRSIREDADLGGAKRVEVITESLGGESTATGHWDWEISFPDGSKLWVRDLARDVLAEWDRIIEDDLGLNLPG